MLGGSCFHPEGKIMAMALDRSCKEPVSGGWKMTFWRILVLAPLVMAALALVALLAAARRLDPGPSADPVRAMALGFVWFLAGTAPFVVFADRLFLRYAYFGSAGLSLMVLALPAAAAEAWRLRATRTATGPAATAPRSAPATP